MLLLKSSEISRLPEMHIIQKVTTDLEIVINAHKKEQADTVCSEHLQTENNKKWEEAKYQSEFQVIWPHYAVSITHYLALYTRVILPVEMLNFR